MFEVPAGTKAWVVVFHTRSGPWIERLCPGRFKHVSMAGFVPDAGAWIVLSWELGRLRVGIVADSDFELWLTAFAGPDPGILRAAAPSFDRAPWRPRLGLFCVPMVAHVLGLRRGALLPDRLWSLLVAEGAEIVSDGRPLQAEAAADESIGAGTGCRDECGGRPAEDHPAAG